MEDLVKLSSKIIYELKSLIGVNPNSHFTVEQNEAIILGQFLIILSLVNIYLAKKILSSKYKQDEASKSVAVKETKVAKQASNIQTSKVMKEDLSTNKSSSKSTTEKKDNSDEGSIKEDRDFVEERENSFTMRLREEEEKKMRHEKNIEKKEIKKKKKLANMSDHDDANDWKVVKRGKVTTL